MNNTLFTFAVSPSGQALKEHILREVQKPIKRDDKSADILLAEYLARDIATERIITAFNVLEHQANIENNDKK